jgi:hypothetical protein
VRYFLSRNAEIVVVRIGIVSHMHSMRKMKETWYTVQVCVLNVVCVCVF